MWSCLLVMWLLIGAAETRKQLNTPRKVTAKVLSPHSIEVSWRDPEVNTDGGAKVTRLYIVRYKETASKDEEGEVFESVRTRNGKVKLMGLTPKTTYDVWVKVVKNKKSSSWSKAIRATTEGSDDKNNIVRNLTTISAGPDAILLSWQPPERANEVVAYAVLTQLANGKGRQRKAVTTNETLEYKVQNLRPHLSYMFRIQTILIQGPHPISQPVRAQTLSDLPHRAPRDVRIEVSNTSHITVTWQPPTPPMKTEYILGYTLQYKERGSGSSQVITITTERDVRIYSVPDAIDARTFMVRIAANTMNGTGPYTEWESAFVTARNNTAESDLGTYTKDDVAVASELTPSPPTEVRLVNKTGSAVNLAWLAPISPECCPVVAYKIVIKNYNNSMEHEIVRGTTHVHLTELAPSTLYGVSLTSLNMMGESKPSKELLFSSLEPVPPKILFFEASAVIVGGDANMTCKSEGYEVPRIDWFLAADVGDGGEGNIARVLESDSDIAETVTVTSILEASNRMASTLLMHKVTPAAQREFVCVARNSRGSERKGLNLLIDQPPRILSSQGATSVIGSRAHLVCEAYGRPVPEILWVQQASGVVYSEQQGNEKDPVFASSSLKDPNPVFTSSSRKDPNSTTHVSHLIVNSSLLNAGAYRCVAQSRAGSAEAIVILNVTVPGPGPVHKIQTVPLSPSRVSVSWLPPLNYGLNIAFYQVSYRKKQGGQPLMFNTSRVGTELYSLDPATEYLVGVIAGAEDALGEEGPEVEVITLSNEGLQPGNVSVKALNSSIVQLDWEAPANISLMYIRGYNVYTKHEGEDRTEKLFVRGSSSKQFLIGLGRDDTYYLKISTMLTWGHEAHSAWIRIQKRSEAHQPPGKPNNVTTSAKRNEITIVWEPPPLANPAGAPQLKGGHLKGYKIVYGPLSDPLNVSRITLGPEAREHVVKALAPSTHYMLSIRAFSDAGDGEPVYARTVTQALPPSMVQNASAQPVSSTEIHVQWEPPKTGHVTRYHIRYWRPGRKDKQSAWMSGNNQNYVAGSLRKNSNYRFEIIPYNGELLGEGIVIFSYTYGDKPDGPPTNVTIKAFNSTTLHVSWSPPDFEKANGDITGYKLVLRTNEGSRMASFRVPGTAKNFTFFNMPVSKLYKFKMAAVTINGTGVFSSWVESTFTPPLEKPVPPQNLTVSATDSSLTLEWKSSAFAGSPVHGYIVGYGQFIPEVYRHILSSSQTTFTMKSLKPDSEYIVSIRAFNHIGESSPTFSIARTKPVPVLAMPVLSPVKLLAVSDSPTSLVLSWVDPALIDSHKSWDGRVYLIRFSPLSGETYSYINTSHLQHTLTGLEPATMYEVSIKVVRGGNSSSWSLPVVNSTQQTVPSTAPESIVASPLANSPSVISLKWSEPRLPNGKIEEYIIYLTSDPTINTKLWVIMRTDKREVRIRDIDPHTSYYFKLQARNRAGYGPLSETSVYSPPTATRAAPTNVTVTGLYGDMSTSVKVSWTLPDTAHTDVTGYMVHYADNTRPDPDWTVQGERGFDTVVVGLEHNRTYYFKVQARYSAAYGPFSKIVPYVTMPRPIKPPQPSNTSRDRSDGKEVTGGEAVRGDSNYTTVRDPSDVNHRHHDVNESTSRHHHINEGLHGGNEDISKLQEGNSKLREENEGSTMAHNVNEDNSKLSDVSERNSKLHAVNGDSSRSHDGTEGNSNPHGSEGNSKHHYTNEGNSNTHGKEHNSNPHYTNEGNANPHGNEGNSNLHNTNEGNSNPHYTNGGNSNLHNTNEGNSNPHNTNEGNSNPHNTNEGNSNPYNINEGNSKLQNTKSPTKSENSHSSINPAANANEDTSNNNTDDILYDSIYNSNQDIESISTASNQLSTDSGANRDDAYSMNFTSSTTSPDVVDNSGSSDYKEYYDEGIEESDKFIIPDTIYDDKVFFSDTRYEDKTKTSIRPTIQSDNNVDMYGNTDGLIPDMNIMEGGDTEQLSSDILDSKPNTSHSTTSYMRMFGHHSRKMPRKEDVDFKSIYTSESSTSKLPKYFN